MLRKVVRRCAIILAWLPLFISWILSAVWLTRAPLSSVFFSSLISLGSAGLLGTAVWYLCPRMPWPAKFNLRFYGLQVSLAGAYAVLWTVAVFGLELLRTGRILQSLWTWPNVFRQVSLGIWLYALFAGVSYAVQTRGRLQEKEVIASRAEAMAAAARLDAIRARLNPHFLFNALHTLSALVKFQPAAAEGAIVRLGDMLRYALKEDGRDVVEFSEEYDFTRKYLSFEELRYEDRLRVNLDIDPDSCNFEIPPFSLQTLAENAVHHAISIRPQGGSIWINCACRNGKLVVTVRDDGPGESAAARESHQFGLRSLRERLRSAFGAESDLQITSSSNGFEASFEVPSPDAHPGENNSARTHEWLGSDRGR